MRGLQDMLEKGVYCIDVITQISAAKQALSGVEDALMESHLGSCAIEQIKIYPQIRAVYVEISAFFKPKQIVLN